MLFRDLREYIERTDDLGELLRLDEADWNLEIGAITETSAFMPNPPAILFDKIRDYTKGYRILVNSLNTNSRFALALGLPPNLSAIELAKKIKEKMNQIKHVKPVEAESAPAMENFREGEKVNLFEFPTPKWHEGDGGRYLGTGCVVITEDPEERWVNLGTYRLQVHDKKTLGLYISPGHHAKLMAQKYWNQGKSCPVAVTFGQDPLIFLSSVLSLPWGVPEFDFAGGLAGEPMRFFRGKITGLPIPYTAEIAIEGEIPPPQVETRVEGPFGEWWGYYGSDSRSEPVVRVKSVYFRNDPIIVGYPPLKPLGYTFHRPIRAATIWSQLEMSGVSDVRGVWLLEAGFRLLIVISIKQRYPGHAKRAANAALGGDAAYAGKFIVVVDDDIDPSDTNDVLWAVATRCDPATSIDIVRGCLSEPLDPRISPERKQAGDFTNSRAIIDACKPFHWIERFPKTCAFSDEYKKEILQKWGSRLRSRTLS